MKRILSTIAAASAILILAGCSGASAPAETPHSHASRAAHSSSAPIKLTFDSTCSDAAGDGKDAADIKSVHLWADGKLVYVVYELGKSLEPATFDDIMFSTTIISSNGNAVHMLGSEFLHGQDNANYIMDMGAAKQKSYDNGTIFADGQVSARYPIAAFSWLKGSFSWYSTVNVSGDDVDACGSTDAPTNVALRR